MYLKSQLHHIKWIILIVVSLVAGACHKTQDQQIQEGSESVALNAVPGKDRSPKSLVKQKRAQLLRNSLAKILNLDPDGQCLELGRLPCANLVHRVSLGGMNAYGNAQYEKPKESAITSPISFDRMVMSACTQRANLDFINPASALIFKDLSFSIDGRLVRDEAITQSIERLYQRAFLREPSQTEISALLDLYVSIYETEPQGAARNWMLLSCYSVLSTTEFVFY